MKPWLSALLLLAALALPAAAATTAVTPSKTPVNVTADTFEVDDAHKSATFSGNVVVKRAALTMWATRVVVAYGKGGPSDISSLTATGGVRIQSPDLDATGDRATFDPASQILKLNGNVKVRNSSGTVTGPELVVDLKKNTSVFSGGKSGRVTGVFTPQ
jgi:lipopolysaccharide export system protein LptA